MTPPQIYIIDTSSLINMRMLYPQDMFNPVWEMVEKLVVGNKIQICSEVFDEIKDDDLVALIKPHKSLIVNADEQVQTRVKGILAEFPGLIDIKKGGSADPFIIAHALLNRWVVVTDEKKSASAKKIPYVCDHFSIPHTNLLGFLRAAGFKL